MNSLAYADSLDFDNINLGQRKALWDPIKQRLFYIMDLVTGKQNVFSASTSATQPSNINALHSTSPVRIDIGRLSGKDFQKQLDEIKKLPDNWNGYETSAPNSLAFHTVEEISLILHEMDFWPTQLNPSAEEGMSLTFYNNGKYGVLECYNDGNLCAAIYERDQEPNVWEVDNSVDEIELALDRINEFVNRS
jgi:hypothetical protein